MSVERSTTEFPGQRDALGTSTASAGTATSRATESDRVGPSVPLHARIERTKERTRIAALERELAASKRRRQTLIDQYERILAQRTCECDRTCDESGRVLQTVRRLL